MNDSKNLSESNTSNTGIIILSIFFIGWCVLLGFTIHYHNMAKKCENKPYGDFCPAYHCPDGSTPENCTHD